MLAIANPSRLYVWQPHACSWVVVGLLLLLALAPPRSIRRNLSGLTRSLVFAGHPSIRPPNRRNEFSSQGPYCGLFFFPVWRAGNRWNAEKARPQRERRPRLLLVGWELATNHLARSGAWHVHVRDSEAQPSGRQP